MNTFTKNKTIQIDGSIGEGGGQILRTALSLSMITGIPFELVNIRAGRKKSGLMRQHLVCVQASQRISNAVVKGAELHSQKLYFQPQLVQAGKYDFQIGSAGSTILVLQTLLPALMMQNEEPSALHYKELEPLTHKENSPILVRNTSTKEFLVKKRYDVSLYTNLERLKEINHPHLPKILEIVKNDQELWLYEEYIHGKNGNELLLQNQLTDTQLILELGKAVTEALMVLHEKNIIHRDIKPSNIMVTNDGIVKLVDFDAIRFYDGSKENDTIHLGTIGFASPEQYGFAETDERSDLYSLGIVLNVCSTNSFPKEHLTTNPFLKELVVKATKIDPLNRYQTAAEMHTAIVTQLNHLNESTNTVQRHPFLSKTDC